MEQGRRRPATRLLEVADEMCGARGKLIAAREYLAPERFPSYSLDFMRYEAEAISVSSYQSALIPGLLQTEEYARALISAHWPPLGDETIEERVAARLERHGLLDEQTRSFSFVIEEGALRRPIDGGATQKAQLHYLCAAAPRRNLTIQVMPSASGNHPGLLGPFVLVETAEHEHMVYEEGQTTGVLYTDPDRVSVVAQRHAVILRQALSPAESVDFIAQLAEAS